ncbi:DUF2637 domain-containing protein [Streptomyces sp. NPDC051320]|uniref:DUF2637 domain-containing protein n=1 Tax=Streptomyces sp. NPDC051320 TaxID=3154644 RepID=UPI0034486E68
MYDRREIFESYPGPYQETYQGSYQETYPAPHQGTYYGPLDPDEGIVPTTHYADMMHTQETFTPQDVHDFGQVLNLDEELAEFMRASAAEAAPAAPVAPTPPFPRPGSHDHRKRRAPRFHRPAGWTWLRMISFALAALTAVIVAMVSAFGAVVSYDPLRLIAATSVPDNLAKCWPLLIFGPWLVASLSVLRATLHHRTAPQGWALVVLFSALAAVLCVSHADKTLSGIAVACLPPITALTCFHQLVRQITLTRTPVRPAGIRSHRATP